MAGRVENLRNITYPCHTATSFAFPLPEETVSQLIFFTAEHAENAENNKSPLAPPFIKGGMGGFNSAPSATKNRATFSSV